MSNIVEFFVKMKDMMSSGVIRLAQNSQQAFGKIQNTIDNTKKKNDTLNQSYSELTKRIKETEKVINSSTSVSQIRAARRELEALNRMARIHAGNLQSEKDILQGSGSFNGLLRRFAPAALLAGAIALGGSSVKAATEYESTNKSYEVLTGSKPVGKALASDLNKLQQDTILGPEVFKGGQTLLAFGVSAQKVMPTIKMLGDIAMGDTERFNSLTLAFAQMTAAGRLQGQDLLQFVNAGFNPLAVMAKTTGKSLMSLRKEMEDGKITSAMVTKAFEDATNKGGKFNEMMAQMATTTKGKMAILNGSFESLKIAIGEHLQPVVGKTVTALTSLVSIVKKWFEVPVAKQVDDQIQKIYELQLRINALNTTDQERMNILKELEQINPNLTKGINAQSIEYGKLQQNIIGVVAALNQKKIADKFQNENTDVIFDYNQAQEKTVKAKSEIIADIVKAAPELLNRTDLTFGQQQLMTKKILEDKIKAGKVTKYYHSTTGSMGQSISDDGTIEGDLLNSINGWIKYNNQAVDVITKLSPKYNKVQSDIKTATDAYNKVFGLNQMATAAGIKQEGVATDDTSKKSKDDVASGITGGGPRVININGVKFAERIEIHATTMEGGIDQMQDKMEEAFLRILNSGAAIQ